MSLINQIKAAYFQLPPWLLSAAGAVYYRVPQHLRYGKDFRETTELLRRVETMSAHDLEEQINQRFLHTVQNAYAHVPFYRAYYDGWGVDMSRIRDIRDITMLPTIDKATLKEHAPRLISRLSQPDKLLHVTTSGSTGAPVSLYQPQSITMTEWAYTLHIWSRLGYRPESSRLVLRGKKLHPSAPDPDVFYDPLRRELSCNVYDMSPDKLEKYCRAIERFRPEFIHGYMSVIMVLAGYVRSRPGGLNHQFKGILATSETVLPEQRAYVEKVFSARVLSFYGHSERLVIAGECEHATAYHIEPLYGWCELLDRQGNPANTGQIVATGFLNDAMPLIRYKTGDLASWDTGKSCPCGRNFPRLKGVDGRISTDVLVNADGTVTPSHFSIHTALLDNVLRYQFIQHIPGEVTVKLVPGPDFTPELCETIRRDLEGRFNGKLRFHMELTGAIPPLPNGKSPMVIQHIPMD